jgi:hypothetical protein
MGVFVSYSSRDKDAVTRLAQDLQDADEQVWLDQRLAGGEAWWRAILEQVRGCDVFIFALSQHSIQSKPCQAELRYAQALGLPILPIQVGWVESMQLNPLAAVQTIDYQIPTPGTAMRLLSALSRARAQRQPLPSDLPPDPPVPFEYLIRLYNSISGTEQLSPPDQAALLAQLQFGLREDGGNDSARGEIVLLLNKLRDREDVTYRTRTEVDAILAAIDAAPGRSPWPAPLLTVSTVPVGPGWPSTSDGRPAEPDDTATTDTTEPRVDTPPPGATAAETTDAEEPRVETPPTETTSEASYTAPKRTSQWLSETTAVNGTLPSLSNQRNTKPLKVLAITGLTLLIGGANVAQVPNYPLAMAGAIAGMIGMLITIGVVGSLIVIAVTWVQRKPSSAPQRRPPRR